MASSSGLFPMISALSSTSSPSPSTEAPPAAPAHSLISLAVTSRIPFVLPAPSSNIHSPYTFPSSPSPPCRITYSSVTSTSSPLVSSSQKFSNPRRFNIVTAYLSCATPMGEVSEQTKSVPSMPLFSHAELAGLKA
jgi:hypothetical protein